MPDPVEAGRLNPGGESQALLDHSVESLPAAGGSREHEEDLVPVAGGGELLGLVAGVLVVARGDLSMVRHEQLHVCAGRAVVLICAFADRLAELQRLGDVVVGHVGGAVTDTVDAVPLLVDLAERPAVAQGRDSLTQRARALGERLHEHTVHAPRHAARLARLEDGGHVLAHRVRGLAELVRVVVAAREPALQRVEQTRDAELGDPRLENLPAALWRGAPVLRQEPLTEGGIRLPTRHFARTPLVEDRRVRRRRGPGCLPHRASHEDDRSEEEGPEPHRRPCRRAAPTKPANKGCGAHGRDRNSGWNWPATNHGWSGSSTISTSCFSGHTPEIRNPFFSRSFRYSFETS